MERFAFALTILIVFCSPLSAQPWMMPEPVPQGLVDEAKYRAAQLMGGSPACPFSAAIVDPRSDTIRKNGRWTTAAVWVHRNNSCSQANPGAPNATIYISGNVDRACVAALVQYEAVRAYGATTDQARYLITMPAFCNPTQFATGGQLGMY